jgi:transposase-like protein
MASGVYVERRNWTPAEKRAIALEAFSNTDNGRRSVSKVARRHGVQNYQVYRWRDKYLAGADLPALVPVRLTPDVLSEMTVSSSSSSPSPAVTTRPAATAEACAEIVRADGQIRIPLSAGIDFIAAVYAALNRT